MSSKYVGIKFRKDDESNIVSITIVNQTTGGDVLRDYQIDLWAATAEADYTNGQYIPYTFWWKLEPAEDTYQLSLYNAGSGDHVFGGLPSPSYHIQIDGYLLSEELPAAEAAANLHVWHEDNPSDIYTYELDANSRTSLIRTTSFNGDLSTTLFGVEASSDHAYEFVEFSIDSGVTWYGNNDPDISWGSNVPLYTDRTINSEGHFWIQLVTAPPIGVNNVLIHWKPKVNKGKIETTLKQPNDGISIVDRKSPVRLLDHGVEFI